MSSADLRPRSEILTELLVVLAATLIALVSAQPYARGWNDGGRLAAVESLVDRRTFAIDDSIFVKVPQPGDPVGRRPPYDPNDPEDPSLVHTGTKDKLFIHGHFYSDKSPVPTLLMALFYQLLKWLTGLSAAYQPGRFCWSMTFLSSGVSYVVSVWAVFRLGRVLRLPALARLLLTASFALATLAPVYARCVNGHSVQLGAAAALMVGLAKLAKPESRKPRWALLAAIGSLAGFGYAADLGAGPPMLACTLLLATWRTRCIAEVGVVLLFALPWLALHHAVTYAIGGTLKPIGSIEEFLLWEGSPFRHGDITGTWNHRNLFDFAIYALSLLVGPHGFINHNLPLCLAIYAAIVLLLRRTREMPELLFAVCWSGGTWLVYGALSNNHAGACCSIRWFLPLLAPGYYVLAVALRDFPTWRIDLLILSAFGLPITLLAWQLGPWSYRTIPGYMQLQFGIAAWLLYRYWAHVRQSTRELEARSPLPPSSSGPK